MGRPFRLCLGISRFVSQCVRYGGKIYSNTEIKQWIKQWTPNLVYVYLSLSTEPS